MNRILVLICIILIAASRIEAQTSGAQKTAGSPDVAASKTDASPELQEASRLNQTVVKLFGEGKFDEALPLAKKVLELREKALGSDDTLVAGSILNLAAIQQKLSALDEAGKLYKRALVIYEKKGEADTQNAINARHALALMEYEMWKSITLHERNLAAKEKVSGPDSMEVSLTLFPLAHNYEMLGDYDKAENHFTRFLSIREKLSAGAENDKAVAYLRLACVLRKKHKSEEAKKAEARAEEILDGSVASSKKGEIIEGGVINGKILSRPAPSYPEDAKQSRAQGTFKVHVLVGETGSVLYACAEEKGHPSLRRASELAAYAARFSATTLSGQSVKVRGIITYNFVLR